ncbi:hypothetical protein QR680_013401 [Steinernema hermaphroditum]|uniref:Transmembrane protein n=1 Tax=Steinernema hermaphroditum TaxID=289476 RepID=A0AA39I867_9BILA|nr:hypothetical protein QR680_013401 [Steinernema hermaphroditum]
MNAAAVVDVADSDAAELASEAEPPKPQCSRPVANCVFLVFAFCVLLFFTLFVKPEKPPPSTTVLADNDVIRYLRKAAVEDQRFQEEFHLRLRHFVLALAGGFRDASMTSDLERMLAEHDEAQRLLMQKNGVKSRLSSAKGRYAREVILHRLTNQMDMWQAYEALLKTIACERTRALNQFVLKMIKRPLEVKPEELKAILDKYDREVAEIEKTVAEMDKRADRLWTNYRKFNTSGVSQCCLKDPTDSGFLFQKYTELYVEFSYSGDSCLPASTICAEKGGRDEFTRWPFMLMILIIVFAVTLFNSKAKAEARDPDEPLSGDDPHAFNDLSSVAIPPFVFRPSADPSASAELLSAAKETDPPPAYTPPHSPPPYASVVAGGSASTATC